MSNPTKNPPSQQATDSRTRLLESMLDAIWERSYGSVSVGTICERAEVHKGSFYHFFKSKTELAIAALEHLWESRSLPALNMIFSPELAPLKRFERLIEYWYERSIECQRERGRVLGCPYFNIGAEMAAVEPEVASKARDILDYHQLVIEKTLIEAVEAGDIQIPDPAETASSLFAMIEGCSMQARIHDDPERVRHFADAFGRVIGAQLEPEFDRPIS